MNFRMPTASSFSPAGDVLLVDPVSEYSNQNYKYYCPQTRATAHYKHSFRRDIIKPYHH